MVLVLMLTPGFVDVDFNLGVGLVFDFESDFNAGVDF